MAGDCVGHGACVEGDELAMVSAKVLSIGRFAQIPRLRFFARMTGAGGFVVAQVSGAGPRGTLGAAD
jgi:hypothetical protein